MDFTTFIREASLWFLIPVGIVYAVLFASALWVCLRMFRRR